LLSIIGCGCGYLYIDQYLNKVLKTVKGEKMDVANLIFGIIGCVIVLLGEAALVLWFMGEVETV
jgi:hypothetical protein